MRYSRSWFVAVGGRERPVEPQSGEEEAVTMSVFHLMMEREREREGERERGREGA